MNNSDVRTACCPAIAVSRAMLSGVQVEGLKKSRIPSVAACWMPSPRKKIVWLVLPRRLIASLVRTSSARVKSNVQLPGDGEALAIRQLAGNVMMPPPIIETLVSAAMGPGVVPSRRLRRGYPERSLDRFRAKQSSVPLPELCIRIVLPQPQNFEPSEAS